MNEKKTAERTDPEKNIRCNSCKYGIPVSESERIILCDHPGLPGYGKNVKHGHRFSCGYGVIYTGGV
jgi:hypothetical protein